MSCNRLIGLRGLSAAKVTIRKSPAIPKPPLIQPINTAASTEMRNKMIMAAGVIGAGALAIFLVQSVMSRKGPSV